MDGNKCVALSEQPSSRLLLWGLAAAIAFCVPAAIRAQDADTSISVSASHNVHEQRVGTSYTGLPIELVQLTHHLHYTQADLRDPQALDALKHRIRMTAEEACKQIGTLYPGDIPKTSTGECVTRAVDGAMQELDTAQGQR